MLGIWAAETLNLKKVDLIGSNGYVHKKSMSYRTVLENYIIYISYVHDNICMKYSSVHVVQYLFATKPAQ